MPHPFSLISYELCNKDLRGVILSEAKILRRLILCVKAPPLSSSKPSLRKSLREAQLLCGRRDDPLRLSIATVPMVRMMDVVKSRCDLCTRKRCHLYFSISRLAA